MPIKANAGDEREEGAPVPAGADRTERHLLKARELTLTGMTVGCTRECKNFRSVRQILMSSCTRREVFRDEETYYSRRLIV